MSNASQSRKRLNVYAIFGIETSEGVKEMGILVASDTKGILHPIVSERSEATRGLNKYNTGARLDVNIKSARFRSAIRLNEKPLDTKDFNGIMIRTTRLTYTSVDSEKKWLEQYLEVTETGLGEYAEAVLKYGNDEKTVGVIPISTLVKTDKQGGRLSRCLGFERGGRHYHL
ncbi:hypothetical protein DFH11DRAFT_1549623 [Phellopilus nigrolimitatus]|nr:hypothetical protein DFH11DRAFT_1549623 [Phellopilus nigrolimitatus]